LILQLHIFSGVTANATIVLTENKRGLWGKR
jgi:hypothetical protein